MQARDVMVRNVVTVKPDTDVADAVKLLVENDVSALPVLGRDGRLVGMISEADLLHRAEIGTDVRPEHWIESLLGAAALATEFAKSHGKKVGEVMTTGVIAVTEDASLAEIAALFERERIKRVPVIRDNALIGIVSRSNLIQALASALAGRNDADDDDRRIRHELLAQLETQSWTDFGSRNVIVHDRIVHLWGLIGSEAERTALIALAEAVSSVARVSDEMIAAY